jgi:hypothetical protein
MFIAPPISTAIICNGLSEGLKPSTTINQTWIRHPVTACPTFRPRLYHCKRRSSTWATRLCLTNQTVHKLFFPEGIWSGTKEKRLGLTYNSYNSKWKEDFWRAKLFLFFLRDKWRTKSSPANLEKDQLLYWFHWCSMLNLSSMICHIVGGKSVHAKSKSRTDSGRQTHLHQRCKWKFVMFAIYRNPGNGRSTYPYCFSWTRSR